MLIALLPLLAFGVALWMLSGRGREPWDSL
jgi:hypothetical protein